MTEPEVLYCQKAIFYVYSFINVLFILSVKVPEAKITTVLINQTNKTNVQLLALAVRQCLGFIGANIGLLQQFQQI